MQIWPKKPLTIGGILSFVFTVCWHLIENAISGDVDDRIGAALGMKSPAYYDILFFAVHWLNPFMIIASVLALVYFFARLHEGNRKVEPTHFIVIGCIGICIFTFLAVTGVIWQNLRQQSPAIAQLQPASTSLPVAKAVKFYSREDKNRLGDALYKLSDILNKIGKTSEVKARNVMYEWDGGGALSLEILHTRIQTMREASDLIEKFNQSLYGDNDGLLKDNQAYADDLNAVLLNQASAQVEHFSKGLSEYSRLMNILNTALPYKNNQLTSDIIMSIRDDREHLNEALAKFHDYIERCNKNIEDKRLSLSKNEN